VKIKKENFGKLPDGRQVDLYTISSSNGAELKITNYGTIITSLTIPTKKGCTVNMVLGFDDFNSYLTDHPYMGAICGRFANRIGNAEFELDGKKYHLAKNYREHTLHGGNEGFDKKLWNAEIIENTNLDAATIRFTYTSVDMEEGYPGNLDVMLLVNFDEKHQLKFEYQATTDKKTHLNLTHHDYFNLNGAKSNILDHVLQLNAKKYTITDEDSIATGELAEVKNTPRDFLEPKKIGKDIDQAGGGYDDNFVINGRGGKLNYVAKLLNPDNGMQLEMYTTEPGVQVYTSNYLDGKFTGRDGITYNKHQAICLEAQHFPDSPNQPHFPSTLLKPNEVYQQTTWYKFSNAQD
jgi:aldose 1-epimerase